MFCYLKDNFSPVKKKKKTDIPFQKSVRNPPDLEFLAFTVCFLCAFTAFFPCRFSEVGDLQVLNAFLYSVKYFLFREYIELKYIEIREVLGVNVDSHHIFFGNDYFRVRLLVLVGLQNLHLFLFSLSCLLERCVLADFLPVES